MPRAVPTGMNDQMIFVGESRSTTAQRRGWVWEDGRLAAKPLFEALTAMGVDPTTQTFVNLWCDPPLRRSKRWRPTLCTSIIYALRRSNLPKVALGKRVSTALTKLGIKHVAITHPAARGAIRQRSTYIKHVADTLALKKKTP